MSEESQISDVAENDDSDFETVSIDIGKTVNEAKNELNENNNIDAKEEKVSNTANSSKSKQKNENKESTKNENKTTENKEKTETQENVDVKFETPIKGEIIREFAKDSLVYSNTLEEWITHNGVDIKADKTSVVKSASKGKVLAIKNDPRYGLTVIVNHDNGYQTVYANLLTAEYVVEGEEIQAGQTIGTVGNSSSFEISDDYHLHFELIKDGEYLNPQNMMDF